MKHIRLFIIALLCALAGMTNTAQATSREVTYHITSTQADKSCTLTFVRTGTSFNYSTGEKTVTITDITTSTGFQVQLDDGLYLQLSLSQAGLSLGSKNDHTGIWLNYTSSQNAYLALSSNHYYVTHVKMTDLDGTALTGSAAPWTGTGAQMDTDVDMVTESDALNFRSFGANITTRQNFAYLTVTYGDPREYAITYTNAVNGQNGVSNGNRTTYNVTTANFNITAPTRTGYTLSTVTFTDAQQTTPRTVTLPKTIHANNWNITEATTLYAQWTPNTYTVTLDNQNATTAGTTEVTATYDAAMPAITVPTRTGYTFGGYYTATNGGGTKYYNADGSSAHNWDITEATTLYAQWTPITYTVGFSKNFNGVSGTMDPQTFTYDEAQPLTANGFTAPTGYTFSGWNTMSNGSGTPYTDGQSVSNLTTTDGGIVYLYAQWTAHTYTVVFNANGGSGNMDNQSFTYGQAQALTANAFTAPTGCYFTRWNTKADGTGTSSYTNGQSVRNLTATNGATVNLYAQWASLPPYFYIDVDGKERVPEEVTEITSGVTSYGTNGTEAWYYVSGNVSIGSQLTFNGPANLILCDGATLTINATSVSGIFANGSNPSDKPSLAIYGQRLGTGTLNVTTEGAGQAIYAFRDLVINGGNVTARQNSIYSALYSLDNIIINRGNVRAQGGSGAVGIYAKYSITLGWTNPTDRITSNGFAKTEGYPGTISVKSGKTFTDGTNIYTDATPSATLAALTDVTLMGVDVLEDAATNDVAALATRLDGKQTNIMLYGRTFWKDGDWNTLCLPFDVTIADSPLAGATVKKLTASTSNLTNGTLTLNFEDETTTLAAGTPYLIKWDGTSGTIENPIFTGVTISSTTSAGVTSEDGKVQFKGTYDQISYNSTNTNILFLGANNTLYYPLNGARIGAFRAYFQLADGQQARSFVLNFGDEETGIVSTTDDTDDTDRAGAWYSLDGRKLDGQPTKRGMYINNGRKVIVK